MTEYLLAALAVLALVAISVGVLVYADHRAARFEEFCEQRQGEVVMTGGARACFSDEGMVVE